jgi:hypothetical protein
MTISEAELETHYAAALTQYQGQAQELSSNDVIAVFIKKMIAILEQIDKFFSTFSTQNHSSDVTSMMVLSVVAVTGAIMTIAIFLWIVHKKKQSFVQEHKVTISKDLEATYLDAMKREDFGLMVRKCVQALSESTQLNSKTLREIILTQNEKFIQNEVDKGSLILYSKVIHTQQFVSHEEWKAFDSMLSRHFPKWHQEFQKTGTTVMKNIS